jgi:hypothetical protein
VTAHRISIVMLALVFSLVSPVMAWAGLDGAEAATEKESSDNGVLLPVIPRGRGDNCVADTQFMRRNHMTMLRHQRDETMREGIRGKQYSLMECVSCHAVTGPDAMPVTVDSPEHFCRACHDYAAVSIDCFQCHASRPDTGPEAGGHGAAVLGVAEE